MKRWTLRIVLFLILGCVTTVAVAWGCVLAVDLTDREYSSGVVAEYEDQYGPVLWIIARRERSGVLEVYSEHHRDQDYLQWPPGAKRSEARGALPSWSQLDQPGRFFDTGGHYTSAADQASGFPMYALRCVWGADGRYGIPIATGLRRGYGVRPALPLRPIWPGFVINTLFYGLIWFGIFLGFGSARRALRRRRGRCPKCAYQLRGRFDVGCSECGWNRPEVEG